MTNMTAAKGHTPFQLSEEQTEAVNALVEFLQSPDPEDWNFTLSGSAGTGKTYCLQEVLARVRKSHAKYAFTAPTNKAAKELRKVVEEAMTIYSFLGLRIDKNGELKTITQGKPPVDLADYDAIFVDEAGMINSNLYGLLKASAEKHQLKVVFIGDRCQLPPVKEAVSPVWAQGVLGVNLETVMRFDNQILDLANELREVIDSPAPCIKLKNANDGIEGIWKMSKAQFLQSIYIAAEDGAFADGSHGKVIAWRNVKTAEYNQLIRSAIFGAAAIPGEYLVGDRIVAAAPCMRGDEALLTTDEEAIVEGVAICPHPLAPKYKAFELKVRDEGNRVLRLLVLHPDSQQQFDNDCNILAHEAKADGRVWKKFWDLKELFHDIKYAYAITAHRSQGSTYERVWVDYQDVLLNRNRKEAFQCLYVATTRPRKQLYLA